MFVSGSTAPPGQLAPPVVGGIDRVLDRPVPRADHGRREQRAELEPGGDADGFGLELRREVDQVIESSPFFVETLHGS